MLGGVPQVAQFYGQSPELSYFDTAQNEAAFVKSRPPLPSDLAQSYRPPPPWPVSATCPKDFILVCEFSELEGPKPLITIPNDGGSAFDKNMYAVKIMAVDYNATNYARSANTFRLSEDTSVMLEDKTEGTYSYIHHFTLYDLHARGFVRPFCMAYISPDKNKLRSNLELITSCFHQVSQYFRYGNYVIFREEMIRRLADLIFTKENTKMQIEETELKQEERVLRARLPILQNNHLPSPLPSPDCSPTHGPSTNGEATDDMDGEDGDDKENRIEGSKLQPDPIAEQERHEMEQEIVAELKEYARLREELVSVEKGIREIEVILEAVNPALKKNKKMEVRFRRLKERYAEGALNKERAAQNIHQDGYCSDEDACRPQPCKPRIRKRSSSHSELVEEKDCSSDPNAPYQPQIVTTINPRRFDRSLRTLHELCSYGAKEGINRLRKLLKFYCRDGNTLHLERQEAALVEPSVSLLTIGRTVTVNFLHAINLQCMANCQWDLPVLGRHSQGMSESISVESLSSYQDSSIFESLPPSYEARFVMGSTYASLESLYYEVDESMEDLFLRADPKSDSLDDGEEPLFMEEYFGSWVDISRSSEQQVPSSATSDPRVNSPSSPHPSQSFNSKSPSGQEDCSSRSPSIQEDCASKSPLVKELDSSKSPLFQEDCSVRSPSIQDGCSTSSPSIQEGYSLKSPSREEEGISVTMETAGSISHPSQSHLHEPCNPKSPSSEGTAPPHQILISKSPSGQEAQNGSVVTVTMDTCDSRTHPFPPHQPCTSRSPSRVEASDGVDVGVDMETASDVGPKSTMCSGKVLSEEYEGDRVSMETASSKGGVSSTSHKGDITGSLDSFEKHPSVRSGDEPVLCRNNKVPVGCYASRLSSMSSDLPGSGIKGFVNHYVFAIHLIYALLSGRTVVIAAAPSKEREVNSLIRTLWMFVPGHSSRYHLVVPWHIKPLCMTDLARMKLVGLSKPKSLARIIPSSVRRYITLFDYDNNILLTPTYKGTFLDAIVSRNKHFQNDQSYLAYIQSVLLQLASKAFLYYHSYCLNSPTSHLLNSTSIGDSTPGQTSTSRVSAASFLAKLGLMDGDCHIVEYWVELIKRQQIDELLRQQGCNDMPTPSIRLDHRVCSRYQM